MSSYPYCYNPRPSEQEFVTYKSHEVTTFKPFAGVVNQQELMALQSEEAMLNDVGEENKVKSKFASSDILEGNRVTFGK